MNVYLPNLRLPSTYQEVEYIESSGTQYILTELDIKDGYRCKFDVAFPQTASSTTDYQHLGLSGGYLGTSGNVYYRLYTLGLMPNQKLNLGCIESFGDIGNALTLNQIYNIEHSWISGSCFVKVDGTTIQSYSTTRSTTLGGKLAVCGIYQQDMNPQYHSTYAKWYSYKIYDSSDNLVMDFVPCIRDSDGVIGMYDLVNNQFYTNSGTGTFSKGNDVTMSELKNAYIGEVWTPGPNTVGYWTFDDRNANQITDFSGNGNNLVYQSGNKISYSQLSGSDYFGNFNKSQYFKSLSGVLNYTRCMWCKISQTGQQYILMNGGIDLIYGFNSGQIEVYDYYGGSSYRTTLKSNTPLNTRMLIGFTKNGTTVTTYYNGSKVGTATFASYNLTDIEIGGNAIQGMTGSLNNVILENKVWSDSDWSDYYNRTKSNYGL